MSVGPLGFFASIAATPLAQRAAGNERTQSETTRQAGEIKAAESATAAAGIGAADGEEHSANERDADGRRLWEHPANGKPPVEAEIADPTLPRQSRDTTGVAGGQLDLTG